MNAQLKSLSTHFDAIAAVVPLRPIRSAADYDSANHRAEPHARSWAADETYPLADLAETLGTLIGDYEDRRYPAKQLPPDAMLRFLMTQHALKQSDLTEIGSQGVVSEILAGKRELNVRQIKALARRFGISPAAFINA